MRRWREQNRERYNQYRREWRRGGRPKLWVPPRCPRCEKRLKPGCSSRYCTDCDRRRRREIAQIPGRKCSGCACVLPLGRLSNYCFDCTRAARIQRANRADRCCSGGCGALLSAGYRHNLCGECNRAYREKLKKVPRLCSWCGDLVPPGWSSYLCRDCESIRGVERRAARGKVR